MTNGFTVIEGKQTNISFIHSFQAVEIFMKLLTLIIYFEITRNI